MMVMAEKTAEDTRIPSLLAASMEVLPHIKI